MKIYLGNNNVVSALSELRISFHEMGVQSLSAISHLSHAYAECDVDYIRLKYKISGFEVFVTDFCKND
jgi:hypothetical protein